MRSVFFIDGFNLYHSLNDKDGEFLKYRWLDLRRLANNLCEDDAPVKEVIYFTAYCTWDSKKRKRHKQYVEALAKHGVQAILGRFAPISRSFRKPMRVVSTTPEDIDASSLPMELRYITHEEKRTDVNMALKILDYTYRDKFDRAYILTADSDITPAIHMAKKRSNDKLFTAVLPIGSVGASICKACDNKYIQIREEDLAESLLPDPVIISESRSIPCPQLWK